MDIIETEVKFFVDDEAGIRNKLQLAGANDQGGGFELNVKFEDQANSLTRSKRLLRLRKDKKTTLTFKEKPLQDSKEFKKLREVEVEVDDFESMEAILEGIGFMRVQVYEKNRDSFVLGNLKILLDKMPYGLFLELEGGEQEIMEAANLLGLDWNKRIIKNYLEMFDMLKQSLGLDFNDVTFSNFDGFEFNSKDHVAMFEAGKK